VEKNMFVAREALQNEVLSLMSQYDKATYENDELRRGLK
jgi:hypothetical protein